MHQSSNAIVSKPLTSWGVFERTITEVQRTRNEVILRRDCGHVAYWAGAASQRPNVGQVEQCLTCLTEEPD